MNCQHLKNGTFTIKNWRVWKNSSLLSTYDDLFAILFFPRYIILTYRRTRGGVIGYNPIVFFLRTRFFVHLHIMFLEISMISLFSASYSSFLYIFKFVLIIYLNYTYIVLNIVYSENNIIFWVGIWTNKVVQN